MSRRVFALLPVLVVLPSCGSSSNCGPLGDPTGIAAGAARLRLELYPAAARCDGDHVVTGGLAPIDTVDFYTGHSPLSVSTGAGPVVVHLLAYGDAAATQLLGEGCGGTTISHGDTACLSLVVHAVAGGDGFVAPPDLTGTGNLDFSMMSMPDLVGCVVYSHFDGLSNWNDCTPPYDGSEQSALQLCQHAGLSTCGKTSCSSPNGVQVCGKPKAGCVCFNTTDAAGHVHVESSGGKCVCATAGDPQWY